MNCVPLYDGALTRRLELFNESILLLVSYHIVVFANSNAWVGTNSSLIGNSMIASIAILLLINIAVMLMQSYWDIKHYLKLRKLRNKRDDIIKERNEAFERVGKHIELFSLTFPFKKKKK